MYDRLRVTVIFAIGRDVQTGVLQRKLRFEPVCFCFDVARNSAQLRTICQNKVSIMDYNHKNAHFEAIFMTSKMNRLKNDENFFNKCGYAQHFLLLAYASKANMNKKVLVILKFFVTEF